MKIRLLFSALGLFFFIGQPIRVLCQTHVTLEPNSPLNTILDSFIKESQNNFDSISILDSKDGFVVVELMSYDNSFLSYFMDTLYNQNIDEIEYTLELRILFLFDCAVTGATPLAYTYYDGRPILFYSGLSMMFKFDRKNKKDIYKIISKHCRSGSMRTIAWHIRYNHFKKKITYVKKQIF